VVQSHTIVTTLVQDIRYGVRLLFKSPGFTLIAAFTLALGIGANSAIFSAVKGVILSVLPYPEADRLVRVMSAAPKRGFSNIGVSYRDFEDWRRENRCFESMALFGGGGVNLTGAGEPEGLLGIFCSSALFDTLKRPPGLGRAFTPEEEKPGGDRVVVISNGLWKRRFAGDPRIVGSAISLDGVPHTVIGVMPADFFFPGPRNEIWLPHRIDPAKALRGSRGYAAVARIKAGVSLDSARAEMAGIGLRLAREYPDTNDGTEVSLRDLRRVSMGEAEMIWMTLVYLGVTFVLLIACANVANLLLARATSRAKEIAIRMSIGSGRVRLLRQLLTESVLLALLGGISGMFVGYWCLKALLAIAPSDTPNRDRIFMDQVSMLYTIGLALLSGVIFGLAPALQATGRAATDALKEGGRASTGKRRHRLLNAFVIAEVAMAAILLVSGTLMVRTFIAQTTVDPGFDTRNLLTLRIIMPSYRYGTPAQQRTFLQDLLARAGTIPGIQAIAAVQTLPLEGSSSDDVFSIEGRPPALPGEKLWTGVRIVEADYFRTMGIPLLLGRAFSEADGEAQQAAIINQTMARRYFASDSNPIGRRILLGEGPERKWVPIVGIVADVHHRDLGVPPQPEIYVPYAQRPTRRMTVVARTAGDPLTYAAAVRSAIWSVDPDQPVSMIRSMEQVVADSVSEVRAVAEVMGALSFFALVLAAVGIYGVVSFVVGERTQEIGVRIAFGAQTKDVCILVLRRGFSLVLFGLMIGTPGALASMRLLRSQLFGVTPNDPVSYLATAIALLLVGVIATLVPIRRAIAVDPLVALRCE